MKEWNRYMKHEEREILWNYILLIEIMLLANKPIHNTWRILICKMGGYTSDWSEVWQDLREEVAIESSTEVGHWIWWALEGRKWWPGGDQVLPRPHPNLFRTPTHSCIIRGKIAPDRFGKALKEISARSDDKNRDKKKYIAITQHIGVCVQKSVYNPVINMRHQNENFWN